MQQLMHFFLLSPLVCYHTPYIHGVCAMEEEKSAIFPLPLHIPRVYKAFIPKDGQMCTCIVSSITGTALLSLSSGSLCTFSALDIVKPNALKLPMPDAHISSAAHGCEKMNIAATPRALRCSSP